MFKRCYFILCVLTSVTIGNNCIKGKCPLIIDGSYASITDFPHSVIVMKHKSRCTGSVLSKKIVLTAAHCVYSKEKEQVHNASSFTIRAGHENCKKGVVRRVRKVVMHNCYSTTLSHRHDIALLFLSKDLPLGPNIKPVKIKRQFPKHLKWANISGWGRYSTEKGESHNLLKYVTMRFIKPKMCCKIFREAISKFTWESVPYRNARFWFPGKMCIGDINLTEFRHTAYRGDSGGALVVGKHQIGLVSHTLPQEINKGNLQIFTNVTYYYDWIIKHAGNHFVP